MPDYNFHTYAPDALVYNPNNGTFTLDSNYDWQTDRNLVEYSDDDSQFDGDQNYDGIGDDSNQVGSAYDDQGNVIANGTVYVQQYAVLRGPNGETIYIDRIEIDGQHVGYVPSSPLTPGVSYNYVGGSNVGDSLSNGNGGTYNNTMSHSYYESNSVPCFATGTVIATDRGAMPVENLRVGNRIWTSEDGYQRVIWTAHRNCDLRDASEDDKPVLIGAGALGPGRPNYPLITSGQHRILVGTADQAPELASAPTLVAAKSLTGLPGIRIMRGKKRIVWHHFACSGHHLTFANGCLAETLLLRTNSTIRYSAMERLRLAALFPFETRRGSALNGPVARPVAKVQAMRKKVRALRHGTSGKHRRRVR